MRMSLSVDGFVAGADGTANWILKSSDEHSKAWAVTKCSEAGLHIMGRKSFESMAAYWPTSTDPFAGPMNEIPKAVFTQKGFKGVESGTACWAQARIFDGDLSESIQALKAEEGNPIMAIGGAGFMRSLISTGLIDEYILVTHPIVLGTGLPIFDNLTRSLELKLIDVKAFPSGVVAHIYGR